MLKLLFKSVTGENRGFTIMEIVVVIFVVIFGLVSILALMNQNIQVELVNKNTIIATELAREGLELVRNKRDDNWLKKEDWKYSSVIGSDFDIIQDGSYTIDHTGTINDSPDSLNDSGTRLYLDSQGFFTHNVTATSTSFSRLITINYQDPLSTKVFVTCHVRWQKGASVHDIILPTLFYDWR